MKKKIIFLDGDGTLWYPTKTQRTQKPHWIYTDPETKDNYLDHLTLAPGVKKALEEIHKMGLQLVVISANPYTEELAVREIKERLEHFGLTNLFHAVRSSQGDDPKGKSAIMLEILDDLKLEKSDALMVGDSYFYDYLAAKDVGIDAFFVDNIVSKMPDELPTNLRSIAEVSDLLEILE